MNRNTRDVGKGQVQYVRYAGKVEKELIIKRQKWPIIVSTAYLLNSLHYLLTVQTFRNSISVSQDWRRDMKIICSKSRCHRMYSFEGY